MMQVAVCDDEQKMVQDMLTFLSEQQGIVADAYESGEALLQSTEENSYDVIFLDIDMPGLSGMDVAAALNEKQNTALIVFVTAHDELVYDSFRYHPFAFVRKTYLEKELGQVLRDCTKELEKKNRRFLFKSEGRTVSLFTKDILYFEAESNYLVLHETENGYRLRATMASVEEELKSDGFIRIHKGFLLNPEHIRTFNTEEITLDNGEVLPIGKAYAGLARAEIVRYMR